MKPTPSQASLVQSLATVSASLAATIASSQAATVQITLTDKKLTMTSNSLHADVTGDLIADIAIAGVDQKISGTWKGVRVLINGGGLKASYSGYGAKFIVDAQFANGGAGASVTQHFTARNIKYLNPINFTDSRINGGASTRGYLEVNAFNSSSTDHTIALTRLVFDNASTTLAAGGLSTSTVYSAFVPVTVVPEPSTSFGLLALGAGGLLIRRRRQEA